MQFGQQGHRSSHETPEANFAPGMYGDPRASLKNDVGQFMSGVMAWMSAGIGVTAAVAMLVGSNPELLVQLFATPMKWVMLFGPVAFVWIVGSKIPSMSRQGAVGSFLFYAGLMGAALSPIMVIYSPETLVTCLVGTSAMFAGTAAFGYLTKRDLSTMGRILMMMFWGLLAMWVVSLFVEGVYWYVALIGLPLFAGLTAWDTQKIKQAYLQRGGQGNLAVFGALMLYIDFVNMFIFMLRLFGGSRD